MLEVTSLLQKEYAKVSIFSMGETIYVVKAYQNVAL